MITVKVKENESVERALKRFKKKFDKMGTLKELRRRTYFTKPSVKNRQTKIRAAYKQRRKTQED